MATGIIKKIVSSTELGDLAYQDSVDYATEVTNKPTLGTMSSVNDAPSDGDEYVRKNGAWAIASGGGGGGGSWGSITGTLSDQTDLQSALDAKANNAIVANDFSTSTAYAVGDLVIYEGGLYKFTSAHSAGAWNASHVTAVIVSDTFVRKYGDTMTENLTIAKSGTEVDFNLKRTDVAMRTAPNADKWVGAYCFKDNNDKLTGYIGSLYNTSKESIIRFNARNLNSSNQNVNNYLEIIVTNNGTKAIGFSDPAAWRKALEYEDSGWKSLTNSSVFTGTIYYRRVQNIMVEVMLNDITLVASQTADNWLTLATIPSGYRPVTYNAYTTVLSRLSANMRGIISINPSGTVSFVPEYGCTWDTTTAIFGSICYVL